MSRSRSVYRSAYSVLVDDPDFQALSPAARHILLTLRWSRECGIACIWMLELPRLARRTGYPVDKCEELLTELSTLPSTKRPWVFWDGDLVWIRNGLRFDPHVSLANELQMRGIISALRDLPRSPLVPKFCRYYGIEYPLPSPSDTHRKSMRKASRRVRQAKNPNPIPIQESESSGPKGSHEPGSTETEKRGPVSETERGVAKVLGLPVVERMNQRVQAMRVAEGKP